MAKVSQVHWAAPATILISLTLGVLFSLGHHLFYQYLAGTNVPNDEYNFGVAKVSPQQLNTSVGTAFAFLVNFSLVAAISTAYMQFFWRSMIYRSKNVSLNALDCTFSALTDIFAVFKLKVWYRHPLLFAVVCGCWLTPIASVVTPGTLSVVSKAILPPPSEFKDVLTPGLDSLKFLSDMQNYGPASYFTTDPSLRNTGEYLYQGPSRAIENVALDVGTKGEVLPITPPNINSTWELDFAGPGVRCSNITGQDREAILGNVANATNTMGTTMYTFLSWTYSWNKQSTTSTLPVSNGTSVNDTLMLPFDGFNVNTEIVDPHSAMPAVLYVATLPCEAHEFGWTAKLEEATFAKCELVNTTYHSHFSYVNGQQDIQTERRREADTPLSAVGSVAGPYYASRHGRQCDDMNAELHTLDGPLCSFNRTLARTLSYQAVFDAFSKLVLGSVTWQNYMNPIVDTNVLNTVLIEAPEMRFVKQMHQNNITTLQNSMSQSSSKVAKGITHSPANSTNIPLAPAMEELFQKLVISSMSESTLLTDTKSAFAPPPVKVTSNNYHNEYVYSAAKLWVAYGIAIFVATVISIVGVIIIFINGASHSFDFSSVFRFAWGASISEPVKDEDTSGQDPLPAYLANATVTYVAGPKKEHAYEEVDTSDSPPVRPQRPESVEDEPPQLPPIDATERL